MLKAFKEKGTTEDGSPVVPLVSRKLSEKTSIVRTFANAWDGLDYDFYIDNGVVKFGPLEDDYREYLQTMNLWYEEGLIAPEFSTYNVTQEMADKQDLVMRQATKATDAEMEKVIKKAMDISDDPYVQWFYYMAEPFSSREFFYTVKLVESLKEFYEDNPLIVDYYVYFQRSGRIANANSLYKKEDFYHLVWSYEGMSEQEWENEILNKNLSGAFLGERIMRRDSAQGISKNSE